MGDFRALAHVERWWLVLYAEVGVVSDSAIEYINAVKS